MSKEKPNILTASPVNTRIFNDSTGIYYIKTKKGWQKDDSFLSRAGRIIATKEEKEGLYNNPIGADGSYRKNKGYYTIDNSSPFAAKLVEAEHKRVVIRDNLIAEQNAKRTKIRYNSGVSHLNSQLAMTNEKHGTTLTRADLEQALNETKGGKGTNFQKLKRYYAAKGINFGNQRESIIKYAWFDTLDNILNYENKGKSQEEESIFNEKESLNKDTVDNWMNLSRQNLSINNLLAQSNNYQSNSLRIANKDISKKESPLSIAGSQPATKTSPT